MASLRRQAAVQVAAVGKSEVVGGESAQSRPNELRRARRKSKSVGGFGSCLGISAFHFFGVASVQISCAVARRNKTLSLRCGERLASYVVRRKLVAFWSSQRFGGNTKASGGFVRSACQASWLAPVGRIWPTAGGGGGGGESGWRRVRLGGGGRCGALCGAPLCVAAAWRRRRNCSSAALPRR